MGMNDIASAERVHIGFFGMRNAGKSSVVNAVTGQSLSVVSEIKGTTTDPVRKAMELLPLGPVVILDTPGMDDSGALGDLRVGKARQALNRTDIAVLVVDASVGLRDCDRELLERFAKRKIPHVVAYNKADLLEKIPQAEPGTIYVSASTGQNIFALKEMLAHIMADTANQQKLLADLLHPGELAVLVIPIDSAAPKGRLILPQQQTLREILDAGAMAAACRERELPQMLASMARKPAMVITDSQAFEKVAKDVPEEIPLTSFSILFARYKGNLEALVRGAAQLDRLRDGDKVLIAEGCTHHRQCEDIGTVKMPAWIRRYTGKKLEFSFVSGTEFPEDVSGYGLIVHCGGCMLNQREMLSRLRCAEDGGVPMTNYGVAIAQMHGILRRSLALFPDVQSILDDGTQK
ncbi:MAG: [FeFe] hydrogenase H-cluster maturation GTPase HydF [Eubacteriales bacterium]|nr:[FeFe] hydrogenase H-cluster maturation GTPase HydF [Eubacteriales bacterium]